MKTKLTVYQKPTCSKCRETLRLLKERGVEFAAVNYYEVLFTETDLRGAGHPVGFCRLTHPPYQFVA